MCTSVFLDIQQAFDKVWQRGLLYKLKLHFPDHLYLLLKSYPSERYFQVEIDDKLSVTPLEQEYHKAASWDRFSTADIPSTQDTLMATFADDPAILSSDPDPVRASGKTSASS